jgi:hypothetical protein
VPVQVRPPAPPFSCDKTGAPNFRARQIFTHEARPRLSFFHLDDCVHSGARMAPRSAAVSAVPAHKALVTTKPLVNSGSKPRIARVQGAVALKDDPDWREF